jgi:hypothetical protein
MLPNAVKHPARAGRALSSISFSASCSALVLLPDHLVDFPEMDITLVMFGKFVFTGLVLFNLTLFRDDPEELWLHIKIGKTFSPSVVVVVEEFRMRIRVSL